MHGAAALHATLPNTPFAYLVLRTYVDEFSLAVDGRTIHTFRDPAAAGRLTFHVVALPPGSAGKRIDIRAPHAGDGPVIGESPYLATGDALPAALDGATLERLRSDALDLLAGLLLLVVGAIASGASAIRRRGDVRMFRAFGAFTLLYGARIVAGSSVPFYFGVPWRASAFAVAFITYVISVPGWMLAQRLLGDGWKSTLRWQVIAFTVFAPIGILGDLITGKPGSLEVVNNVLVIIGGAIIVINLLRSEQRKTPELRVVLLGATLFLLFALNNNLSALGIVPWRSGGETFGFLVFVAALGFAATRAFSRGERAQMAIELELSTAREIQQSILPRAMPDLPGLRFDAAYVPATSVGGDMYSFLDSGRGTGVLVADVAGHGVPAALIASMVKIAVSSQARLADDPAAVLGALNAILRRDVRRAFVTATYLWIDRAERRVVVSNAGHPPPLLLRDDTLLDLGENGVVLGRFPATYTAVGTELREGDRIVACTDGITEARNARDEMFGEERFHDLLRKRGSAEEVLAAVRRWRIDGDDADDLTIVMIDVC